jgi:hypothetical protein
MTTDDPYPEGGSFDETAPATAGFQGTRWRTLSVAASVEEVREALALALVGRKPLPGLGIKGFRTRAGFVLRCTIQKKSLGAELELAGWEGGTQVHLGVPDDEEPSAAQLAKIVGWLELVFAENGWRAA